MLLFIVYGHRFYYIQPQIIHNYEFLWYENRYSPWFRGFLYPPLLEILLNRCILLRTLNGMCNAWNISSHSTMSHWFMPWYHWIEIVYFLKQEVHGSFQKAKFYSWNVSLPCGSHDDKFSSPHQHSLWKDIVLGICTVLTFSFYKGKVRKEL